jgi:DNA mismatch repair protein MutS
MGIATYYLDIQQQYEKQYGERTVVLIEYGSFYDIYEYDPTCCASDANRTDKDGKVWKEHIGHAREISVILNYSICKHKPSKPYSIDHPYMMGFPKVAYEKNREVLLANNYVIVKVNEIKASSKGKNSSKPMTRVVTEIISPTMQFDNISLTKVTSNIVCVYIEYQYGENIFIKRKSNPLESQSMLQFNETCDENSNAHRIENYSKYVVIIGVAIIDIITGSNKICEFYSKDDDPIYSLQELYRFIISHAPKELIIHIMDFPIFDTIKNAGFSESDNFIDGENTWSSGSSINHPYLSHLENILELRRFDRVMAHVDKIPPEYKKLPYQINFLNKIFNKSGTLSEKGEGKVIQNCNSQIINDLGIENFNYGRIAYISLLQYCNSYYSHTPDDDTSNVIRNPNPPDTVWIDEKRHLILTHNAICQLNLLQMSTENKFDRSATHCKNRIDSLSSVLDFTKTNLGKRSLQNLLRNPMLNNEEIEKYYDMTERALLKDENGESLYLKLDKKLRDISDISKLQRKLELRLISPGELSKLFKSYIKIKDIYELVREFSADIFPKADYNEMMRFTRHYNKFIDFDILETCTLNKMKSGGRALEFIKCPIRKGKFKGIDKNLPIYENIDAEMRDIIEHLNLYLAKQSRGAKQGQKKIECKYVSKDAGKGRDKLLFVTSKSKAASLIHSDYDKELCGHITSQPFSSQEVTICSDKILELAEKFDELRLWLEKHILSIYDLIVEQMTERYKFYFTVANFIATIDVIHSYAMAAQKYNYHRPITEIGEKGSYFEAQDLRHPIIERIIDGRYVTNDIKLGATDDVENGLLLYGVNETGKTSFGKAIALIIVMAQMGCFVPAKLRYVPYSKIITRLSGSDDMFKGRSSFRVEMEELRTIIRQADNRTLVVGDELARGTEALSASSITTKTIKYLINKDVTFIFATHMHHLLDSPHINNLIDDKLLKICHLSMSQETYTVSNRSGHQEEETLLVYDRKLKQGNGDSIYGLMVLKSLNFPEEFVNGAYSLLHEIDGTSNVVSTKTSRYNSNLYVTQCALCKNTKVQSPLQTHHIEEQHTANFNGMIDSMHKNNIGNLIVLCDKCHNDFIHKNKIQLETKNTSNGRIVKIKKT